ncbi:MAG: family transporter [Conexibacter sp.]|nr:family transporter [Conexibacter sp.]
MAFAPAAGTLTSMTSHRDPGAVAPGPTVSLDELPPNFYAIPFGVAGLAVAWRVAESVLSTPAVIADALFVIAAALWMVLTGGLLRRLIHRPAEVMRQLGDAVLSPFMALPAIVALVLAGGLLPHAPSVAKIVALTFVITVVALGGWLTGQWIAGELDVTRFHPGYFLPTVAGGLLAANVTALMGYRTIGWMTFGIGVLCWLLIGPMILGRLFFAVALPSALAPTLAIEVAPPAVAGNAYFVLHHGPDDTITYILAGYCVLMVLVQLRLVGVYRRLPFAAGFWSFTFSYTAVATYALRWVGHAHPDDERLLGWVVLVLISSLVLAIALRSIKAIADGTFFPTVVVTPGRHDLVPNSKELVL